MGTRVAKYFSAKTSLMTDIQQRKLGIRGLGIWMGMISGGMYEHIMYVALFLCLLGHYVSECWLEIIDTHEQDWTIFRPDGWSLGSSLGLNNKCYLLILILGQLSLLPTLLVIGLGGSFDLNKMSFVIQIGGGGNVFVKANYNNRHWFFAPYIILFTLVRQLYWQFLVIFFVAFATTTTILTPSFYLLAMLPMKLWIPSIHPTSVSQSVLQCLQC